jgi:hypothetical protein
MPARVGMSVGAVRCLQKGWRWGVSVEVEQRGFVRPRKPHFGEQAMRHNVPGAYFSCGLTKSNFETQFKVKQIWKTKK